jgi:NMD protein affecting ribosome stability and mRNA decay
MRNKRYTNTTFTKRVDHEAGRHRPPRSQREPSVCAGCGATYSHRRWTRADEPKRDRSALQQSVQSALCPACKQERAGVASGFLYVKGEFFIRHQQEINQLLRNEAERDEADNPLARIMGWEETANQLVVKTTTEHLAQRLGHALEKAFDGDVRYDFSHENKLARVYWERGV